MKAHLPKRRFSPNVTHKNKNKFLRFKDKQQEDDDPFEVVEDTFNLTQLIAEVAADPSGINEQLIAVQAARKLSAPNKNPPIDDLMNSGLIPTLLQCVKEQKTIKLRFEAAWTLLNFTTGTEEQIMQVVAAGAVPIFVQLLSSSETFFCEQAAWVLGNIAGANRELRDYVLQHDVIKSLQSVIERETNVSLLRSITWVFENLCQHEPPPPASIIVEEILPALNQLIHHTDLDILTDIVWIIKNLTKGDAQWVEMLIESGLINKMVPLLGCSEKNMLIATLGAIGNIVSSTSEHSLFVLHCNVLEHFPALLSHKMTKIRKEAMWILTNIARWNQFQAEAIINAGLLPNIINIFSTGSFQLQKEAAWTVWNLIENSKRKHITVLINEGVIQPMCNLLTCPDVQIILIVLSGLNTMLQTSKSNVLRTASIIEHFGGLEKIESLQYLGNEDIFRVAHRIMEKFVSREIGDQFWASKLA